MNAAWNVNPSGTQCGLDDARIRTWNATDGEWQMSETDTVGGLGRGCGQVASSFGWESIDAGRVDSHGFVGLPVGGQGITYFLPGDASNNYTDTLARVAACGRRLARIVWWQGESNNGMSEATYRGHLETLRTNWRADFGAIPIYVFRPWVGACGNDMTGVRAAIDAFGVAHSDVTVIDTDAYSHDGCHCQWTGGYETAGQDLYAAVVA